jgi:carbamoyl-phosphate synthase small subunit
MALAYGGQTEKLKYGHRGANQPVVDVAKDRVFVTTQNHGYAVVGESIAPSVGKVSHYNANDHSCEGIVYTRPDTFTVQFHPEACAGPHDTQYLFDNFVSNMVRYKQEKEKEKLK